MNAKRKNWRKRAPPQVMELTEFEARQDDGLTDERLTMDELIAVDRRARRELWPRG